MKLSSKAVKHGDMLPQKYSCEGENISPPLEIKDIPPRTRTLVLVMDDHDVPREISSTGVWDHWIVFNIPADTKVIPEGKNPKGKAGKNSWGELTYGGPCPPDRPHNYTITIYAIDGILDLEEGATKLEILRTLEGHIISNAKLSFVYAKHED